MTDCKSVLEVPPGFTVFFPVQSCRACELVRKCQHNIQACPPAWIIDVTIQGFKRVQEGSWVEERVRAIEALERCLDEIQRLFFRREASKDWSREYVVDRCEVPRRYCKLALRD
jgi:hypothetical protein